MFYHYHFILFGFGVSLGWLRTQGPLLVVPSGERGNDPDHLCTKPVQEHQNGAREIAQQ